jgi:hypothetical protein
MDQDQGDDSPRGDVDRAMQNLIDVKSCEDNNIGLIGQWPTSLLLTMAA